MGFLIEISLIALAIFIVLVLFGSRLSANAASRAGKIIMEIDKKYENFVQKKLTMSVLKKSDLSIDKEQVKQEVMIILKPDIEALISQISATKNTSDVKIGYNSKYFQNLSALAEKYYRITNDRNSAIMSSQEIEEFFEAIRTGINADLTKRVLDLEAGNF